MPFEGLREFLSCLEANDELARISKKVNNDSYEVSAILDRLQRLKGKAVVFENLNDSNIPLRANVFGTFKRIALALETTEDLIFNEWIKREKAIWPSPKKVSAGPCQEVIINEEDVELNRYPILKWNPLDAASYVTLGVFISKDPETDVQNAGIYRLMVQGKAPVRCKFA